MNPAGMRLGSCALMLVAWLALPGMSSAASGDFNGDGTSDIVWQDSTGLVDIWLMNGTAIANSGSPGNPGTAWTIQGVGDFNGDGKADILWQNSITSQIVIWLMNGTAISTTGTPGSPGPDWSVQGIGDFNGDGMADIVWKSSSTGQVVIWLMNGTTITSSGIAGGPGGAWSIVGVGDFNGDHKSDLLWQNGLTGEVVVWLMNGTAIASTGSSGGPNSQWSVQGIGDFNGDGMSDILWLNATSGQSIVWLMNGAAIASSGSPGSPGLPWNIQGVGDFNGDGKADILWQNSSTRQVAVWLMNGAAIANSGSPGSPPNNWTVAALAPYGCSSTVLCNILSGTNNVRANGSFGAGNPAPSATAGGPLLPLTWSPSAGTVAQSWAASCPGLNHNPNRGPFGENIYIAGSTSTPVSVTGTDAVNNWDAEASNYTYSSNTCAAGQTCSHYTQLVWRNTTAVGCAVAQCTTNSPFGAAFPDYAIEVCDYSPPGNFNGQSPY